jgi:type I restriction enzyme R subunit
MGDMSTISHAMNIVFRAKELTMEEKREKLIILLIKYEIYLKKIYYLIHQDVLQSYDNDGEATLKNAINAFSALRGLKNNNLPEYQLVYKELSILRNLRNKEAHNAFSIEEYQIDTALDAVTDMYIFITATQINGLETAYNRIMSTRYEELNDNGFLRAADKSPLQE